MKTFNYHRSNINFRRRRINSEHVNALETTPTKEQSSKNNGGNMTIDKTFVCNRQRLMALENFFTHVNATHFN